MLTMNRSDALLSHVIRVSEIWQEDMKAERVSCWKYGPATINIQKGGMKEHSDAAVEERSTIEMEQENVQSQVCVSVDVHAIQSTEASELQFHIDFKGWCLRS